MVRRLLLAFLSAFCVTPAARTASAGEQRRGTNVQLVNLRVSTYNEWERGRKIGSGIIRTAAFLKRRENMRIDAHAHSDELIEVGWIDPPEKVLKYMDLAEIDMACISTYCNAPGLNPNALSYIADAVRKYPDRFIGFVRLDPAYGQRAIDTLIEAAEVYGFKGVKLHPVDYLLPSFSSIVLELMRIAGERDMPVLFHCADEKMCLPLEIEAGIKEVPETNIILGHMGGFFHGNDAIEVAKRNKNVYLETCEQPFARGIRKAVEELGPERVLFGTDMPTDNPLLEVEKIKYADLDKEAEEMIFYKNIARLLNLDV